MFGVRCGGMSVDVVLGFERMRGGREEGKGREGKWC